MVEALAQMDPEEVEFRSGPLTLAGTFVDVVEPRATALILSGSGKLDRDSNTPKLKLEVSSAIARKLGADKVVSLRYDKRGVGQSEGDYLSTGMTENYEDARAALRWLSMRCPDLPVFVIGHSEGSLHAAHLATEEKMAGAVLLACPARVGEEILTWQAKAVVQTLPRSTKAILKLIHLDPLKSQRKQFKRFRATTADVIRVQGKKINARWFRQFLDYDPIPIFERITVPVLAVIGSHDLQIPPEDVQTIKRLVKGPFDGEVIDDLSHLLRPDPDKKGPRDYKTAVRQPVSPEVLTMIAQWVNHHLV